MKFNKLLRYCAYISVFGFLYFPNFILAQGNEALSLLVGEWSDNGQCGSKRYVFTQDERYQLLEREGDKWISLFDGIYVPTGSNTVAVASDGYQGGDTFTISSITSTSLVGIWSISYGDEVIEADYERCS